MSTLDIRHGDNLATLAELKAAGAKFDLVELDGPYMAGLEDWDSLSEAEYIQHYADRLALVRDVLQPWGVVFVFGYPEGCAEIKSWAHRSGTLYLRRWLTWYKQRTAHKGRKVENVLMFLRDMPAAGPMDAFRAMLKQERLRRAWSLVDVGRHATQQGHITWWHRGGNMYFETGSGDTRPSLQDFCILARVFQFDPYQWPNVIDGSYPGLTDLDYIAGGYPEDSTDLNDAGLRSKPVQLYLDLFRPTIPPTDTRRALVLYGGSGNAGIAAAALGYDVTICETDPARVTMIRDRWAGQVAKWTEKAQAKQAALPMAQAAQGALFGAEVTR